MEIILNEVIEEFKEYGANYMISNWGRVYSKKRGRFLKPYKDFYGYYVIDFYENGKRQHKRIHRLVFEMFGDLPDDYWNNTKKYYIHHIDLNKLNNHIKNLQCIAADEHSSLHKKGKKHSIETRKKMSEAHKGKRFCSKVTILEEKEIIEKIIAYKVEGLTNADAFRLLSEIYPLKFNGIASIWARYINGKKREE